MMEQRQSQHGEWRSQWTFILAATAAAVGLGNIWKFPYVAGQNGGAVFVIIYLIAIVIIGVPLLMAEIALGRNGRQNPASTLKTLALEGGRSPKWWLVGGLSILSGFLILSYYSVIAGWALSYVFKTLVGTFSHATSNSAAIVFHQLISSPLRLLFWHTIIMATTIATVALGVQTGIETAIRYIFPLMVALLLVLIGYSMGTSHFEEALQYMFKFDFHKLNSTILLKALGQAFFTLSLATGSIMMYGAYLPSRASVATAAVAITLADTLIAILAGMAIFPIVFANDLVPSAGPGLIFQTLPIAFGNMPYGTLFGTLFFVMLVFAAYTSAISLLEPSTAFFIESFKVNRVWASIIVGFGIWLCGIATILSFNYWSDLKFYGHNIFTFIDNLTANISLPLVGLLIAIFAVWRLNKDLMRDELQLKHEWIFSLWRFFMRYVTPTCILFIFFHVVGVI